MKKLIDKFIHQLIKIDNVTVSFGSYRFRVFVLSGLILSIIIVCLLGRFTLEQNKKRVLTGVGENLKAVVATANERLNLWVEQRTSLVDLLGRDPELVEITKRLLAVPVNREALLASSELQEARDFFKNNDKIFANIGFFIISPDHISIGSMRDTNIGIRNLISSQRPDLLKRAFQGEVMFVPPIQSDVALVATSKSGGSKNQSTKFFIGPIRDYNGEIIAAMTLRIDPTKDFSQVLQVYGMLQTGETYAFNQYGELLSESRFTDQLRRIGLIDENQGSALNVQIRDPGVNMVEGYHSELERSQQPFTRMVASTLQLKEQVEIGEYSGHSEIEIDVEGYRDYRGVPVFGAWLWNAELRFGIATEIDSKEALATYYMTRLTIFIVLGFTLILSVIGTLFVLIVGERTSKALIAARDNLEDKVKERTAELENAHESIKQSGKKFRAIFDQTVQLMAVLDTKGNLLEANRAALKLAGTEESCVVGKPFWQGPWWRHSEEAQHAIQESIQQAANGEFIQFETTHPLPDGTECNIDFTLTPVTDEEGKIIFLLPMGHDITERKQKEKLQQLNLKISQSLTESNVLQKMLQSCAESMVNSLRSVLVRIWIYNEHDAKLELQASAGIHTHIDGDHGLIPIGQGKVGKIAQQRCVFRSNDIANDPLIANPEWIIKQRLTGYAGIPLIFEEKLVGVLVLFARRALDDDDINSLESACHNISVAIDRKKAEERLVSRENQFRNLIESAPDAMVIVNDQGTINMVNGQTERLFGYDRAEIVGQKIEFLIPERFRKDHVGMRDSYIHHPILLPIGSGKDFYALTKDGREVSIEISLSPIKTDDGLLVISTLRDVTERKRMEKELSNERERLQEILDTSPVGVAITIDGVVRFLNHRMVQITNLHVGCLVEKSYVNPDDRHRLIEMFKESGVIHDYEAQLYGPNQEIRDLMCTFMNTEYEGEIGILGWAVDITELKKTENELREKFDELARFRNMAVGREHKMIELKKEINELLVNNGLPEKYKIH